MEAFLGALFGAVFGTVATLTAEWFRRWMQRREKETEKLARYAKPVWLECDHLEYRLNEIVEKLEKKEHEGCLHDLNWRGQHEQNIYWMNGDGYYITSTGYLLAAVSCWIELWEDEVAFLPFKRDSTAVSFFQLIKDFKRAITTDTCLWFHYLAGIGQALVEREAGRPITISEFVFRLDRDEAFRAYYDQLFHFLHDLGEGRHTGQLRETVGKLGVLKSFLEEHGAVPEVSARESDLSKQATV